MAEGAAPGNVVLLLDNYSLLSRRLHESIQKVESEILVIVITEDNFLPDNVMSIYDLMIGNYIDGAIRKTTRPRYFNEIPVPDSWSIRMGDESSGSIICQQVEKGKILYADAPKKRLVREVVWYDRAGTARFLDHYNRYGDICARTVYNSVGEAASKTWLSPKGQEIVVDNYMTHDILLNDGDMVKLFRSREELMLYCLKKAGFQSYRIFINSLATPFILANRLGGKRERYIILAGNSGR